MWFTGLLLGIDAAVVLLCSGAAGKLVGLNTATLVDLLQWQYALAIKFQHCFRTCMSLVDTIFKDASMDILKRGTLHTPGRLAAKKLQNIARAQGSVVKRIQQEATEEGPFDCRLKLCKFGLFT